MKVLGEREVFHERLSFTPWGQTGIVRAVIGNTATGTLNRDKPTGKSFLFFSQIIKNYFLFFFFFCHVLILIVICVAIIKYCLLFKFKYVKLTLLIRSDKIRLCKIIFEHIFLEFDMLCAQPGVVWNQNSPNHFKQVSNST